MSSLLLSTMIQMMQTNRKRRKLRSTKQREHHPSNTESERCRICDERSASILIFNNEMKSNIPEEIKNISGVVISEYDNASKYMCHNCLKLLNKCILFREMCIKSAKRLKKIKPVPESNQETTQEYNEPHDDHSSDGVLSPPKEEQPPSPLSEQEGTYSCSKCFQQFYDEKLYMDHLTECKKKLPKKVRDPSQKSVKKKDYLCETCGKAFISITHLNLHMVIHENIFPFKCETCPYRGRTKNLLIVHKRSHLIDKPYKCTECPKTTTSASNLKRHMFNAHSSLKRYKCDYCEKLFSQQQYVKRHIMSIHYTQNAVECEICYKKFKSMKNLRGHRIKIHKIRGERIGRVPSYLQCQPEMEQNMDD